MFWLFISSFALANPSPPSVEEAIAMLDVCKAPGHCEVPCWDDAVRSTEPGPEGALQVNCFRGDVPHGPVVAWHANGRPLGVGYSLNGRPHGGAVSWHSNGKRASESFWIDGAHEGLLRTWHSNGQLESNGEWKNNQQQGVVRFWYPSGQLNEAGQWVDGRPNGPMFSWHENGQMRAKARYKNGERTGKWKLWFPSGQRSVVLRFRGDAIVHQRCWGLDGKQVVCPEGVAEVSSKAESSTDEQ